ncbi:Calcineurin-like phosphoesterase [Paenibacillus catalpae]|uniref:Calcineurin-like phosphoesterase n=1 Tax=Paenibacillus catalpae TaxID=1045775 RepID=A0A1I2GR46_9BACL|nr:metallophosphoesterase [Paenibacillus catalpae]SFF19520.1 Calcineurin-like phosphoesterase [Paenibacillus catalpae]
MSTIQLGKQTKGIWFDEKHFSTDKRPWFGELPQLPAGDFSFAVVGDRCGLATPGVFEKALDLLTDLKPSFILSVGDLIEGYWRDPANVHEEWDEIDAKIAATGVPFFQVVGNHDYGNPMMADVWRARKGFEYYAFRMNDVLYLIINTENPPHEFPEVFLDTIKQATELFKQNPATPLEQLFSGMATMSPEEAAALSRLDIGIGEEQLAFFQEILENNRDVKHTFVTMHKPGWKSDNADFAELERMLEGRSHTVFAGHFHSLEYTNHSESSKQYIQLGRTGGLTHGANRSDENLILWVTMKSGVPSYRVIHLGGVDAIENYEPQDH